MAPSRKRAQQYIIHRTIPISTVAATIPKITAAGSRLVVLPSRMASVTRLVARSLGAVTVLFGIGCSEPTTPVGRFAVLDDVGQITAIGPRSPSAATTPAGAQDEFRRRLLLGRQPERATRNIAAVGTTCGTGTSKISCGVQPDRAQPALRFLSISAGSRHTCGIAGVARGPYCWGANDQGQVGDLTSRRSAGDSCSYRHSGGRRSAPAFPIPVRSAPTAHSSAGARTTAASLAWAHSSIRASRASRSQRQSRWSVPGRRGPVHERSLARCTVGGQAVWTSREGGLEVTRAQLTPQLVPQAPATAVVAGRRLIQHMRARICPASRIAGRGIHAARWEREIGMGTPVPQRVAAQQIGFVQLSAGIVQSCGVA